jgi:chitinase
MIHQSQHLSIDVCKSIAVIRFFFFLSEFSCYFANWAAKRYDNISRLTPEDIDPFLCTHINFAFGKVLESLTIAPYEEDDLKGWTASSKGMYERILKLKEANPDLRVLLSVGGWTHASRGFNDVSKTAGNMYVV